MALHPNEDNCSMAWIYGFRLSTHTGTGANSFSLHMIYLRNPGSINAHISTYLTCEQAVVFFLNDANLLQFPLNLIL